MNSVVGIVKLHVNHLLVMRQEILLFNHDKTIKVEKGTDDELITHYLHLTYV